MVLSNAQQFSVLVWSLLFGGCLGVAYDFLRAFRIFVFCSAVPLFFQDLFYFSIASVSSFLFIFEVNDGTVRLFILLAFLAGGVAERFTVGVGIVGICRFLKAKMLARPKRERHVKNKTHKKTRYTHKTKAGKNVA